MFRYLIFVIFGILLFLLLNLKEGFSIGIPDYLLYKSDDNYYIVDLNKSGGTSGNRQDIRRVDLSVEIFEKINAWIGANPGLDPRREFPELSDNKTDYYKYRLQAIGLSQEQIKEILNDYNEEQLFYRGPNFQSPRPQTRKLAMGSCQITDLIDFSPFQFISPELLQSIAEYLPDLLALYNMEDLLSILELFVESRVREALLVEYCLHDQAEDLDYIMIRVIISLLSEGYSPDLIKEFILCNDDQRGIGEELEDSTCPISDFPSVAEESIIKKFKEWLRELEVRRQAAEGAPKIAAGGLQCSY